MFAPMKHRWDCNYCSWHLQAPTERILSIEIYKHLEIKHADQKGVTGTLESLHVLIKQLS